MVQPTRIAIGHCSLFGLCRCPLLALPRLVSASQQPWQAARQDCRRPLLAACLWNAPLVVWSTPPGLPDLVAAGQAAEHARDQRRYPRPPDPLEEAPGYPIAGAPDIVHPSIGPPRGPPTPTPVRWEMPVLRQSTHPVDTCETDCGVLVLTPGYLPEALTLRIGLPCDVEDFIEAVERRHSDQRPAFCTRVQPARPQPLTQCATCIVTPDWVSYAALSVVCLDLRDLGTAGDGPLIAAYVTRPTCREELCRQAGIFGTRPCQVFVGTDATPLADDEAAHLANGCVVTFLQQDARPFFANDLQYRLQFPAIWSASPALPPAPALRALLLLRRRARHLFRLGAAISRQMRLRHALLGSIVLMLISSLLRMRGSAASCTRV